MDRHTWVLNISVLGCPTLIRAGLLVSEDCLGKVKECIGFPPKLFHYWNLSYIYAYQGGLKDFLLLGRKGPISSYNSLVPQEGKSGLPEPWIL